MNTEMHLWAVGYEDVARASQVRDEIVRLAWGDGQAGKYIVLVDVAVVVRQADGAFVLDHRPIAGVANIVGCSAAGFLAGLVLGTPLTGAAVGAVLGGVGSAVSASTLGIGHDFIQDVKRLMKPGTSCVFVVDEQGDMEIILRTIQGLGGTVLKTNVNPEHAALIQSTLSGTRRG
jgi:uncharacterized membrane protein